MTSPGQYDVGILKMFKLVSTSIGITLAGLFTYV